MNLLTARDVERMLDIDKSTVYRMAGDGRLPAVKVGRQWRFPASSIERILGVGGVAQSGGAVDAAIAGDAVSVFADALGVMMVVTDAHGVPLTPIANPAPRLVGQLDDPEFLAGCLEEWRILAADVDLAPRFERRALGFECARGFIRSGVELVGMVIAGGVAPLGSEEEDLYVLDADRRRLVVDLLPRIAALLTKVALTPDRRTPR